MHDRRNKFNQLVGYGSTTYSTTKPTGWTHGLIVSTVIFITARRYYKIFGKYNQCHSKSRSFDENGEVKKKGGIVRNCLKRLGLIVMRDVRT